jgi:S1-C subfamily serine protease
VWRERDLWIYPDPARVGLAFDPLDQALVASTAADSSAAAAGLAPGDRLVAIGDQPNVRTIADVQFELHRAAFAATRIPIRFRRGDTEHAAELELADGWKRTTPEHYAWRPYKWNLSPAPGFGGPALSADERRALGLAPDEFAFRVQYIVDWGDQAHRGAPVKKAGIKKGDVVLSFAGKRDFRSIDHFHAWVSLTRTAGETVEVELLRGGERRTVELVLPE